MLCSVTVARYPRWYGWAGFLSMAVFRLPLWLNAQTGFWKLMGSGKNGTFDRHPDWRQWAVLQTGDPRPQTPGFLLRWWKFFGCETWTVLLEPLEGHGSWDGKSCFGDLPRQTGYEGMIGILTRATIRINKLRPFWQNVNGVAGQMAGAAGLLFSIGIGEIPLVKQATFSIWESKEDMKQFAYRMQEHTKVIQKTRTENWYSEEMFVRFKILASDGTLKGKEPLAGKLI